MTPDATRKLERLQGRLTLYELALEHGETRYLVAYCMRQGRRTILDGLRKHGETIVAVCGLGDDAQMTFPKPASLGAKLGEWRAYFTGRTQREAISEGELPWIGDLKAKETISNDTGITRSNPQT